MLFFQEDSEGADFEPGEVGGDEEEEIEDEDEDGEEGDGKLVFKYFQKRQTKVDALSHTKDQAKFIQRQLMESDELICVYSCSNWVPAIHIP